MANHARKRLICKKELPSLKIVVIINEKPKKTLGFDPAGE